MPALDGIRVLELAGLATGPFTGLMLADNGASVLRVDRATASNSPSPDNLVRYKSSIVLDLKSAGGIKVFLDLIASADVLIDPFRPGVLEKMGLGPEAVLLKANPRLIVAQLTGFRRDGRYSQMAGHDINYLAVSGLLSMLGPAAKVGPENRPLTPSPPGNIIGDFAGGGLMCFVGILLALLHREKTGKGQVVQANMVDGASYLATMPRMQQKQPEQWDRPRGQNLVDGGCPYYSVYECKNDGNYMAVAALEPKFFQALSKGLSLCESDWGGDRNDRKVWPKIRAVFEDRFRSKTREEWEQIFQGTDACCTPVLTHPELENAGYEQRAAVGLTESPSLPIGKHGWDVPTLEPGAGGEDALKQWMGWVRDRDYMVEKGSLVRKEGAKL